MLTKEKSRQKRKGVNNQNNSASYFRLLTLFLHHHFLFTNSIKKKEMWSKEGGVLHKLLKEKVSLIKGIYNS
jgi:hypothetical protein